MTSARRTIAVVTGSRADYGLLVPVMRAIRANPSLRLQVIATGMHLSRYHGRTVAAIAEDGFPVDAEVEALLASDEPVASAKSVGLGIIGFADALSRLHPDLLLVLGDRFEILAVVQAALFLRIPVAHLHGGESTEGAIDDAIRHAISKMSHIHFTAAEPYRARVVQLGEDPARVFNVGATAIDNVTAMALLERSALEADLGLELAPPLLLVTYHPATLGTSSPGDAVQQLLAALESLPQARVVFTKANADAGGATVNECIARWCRARAERAVLVDALGTHRYLSLAALADAVVGNSSSGLIEVPALGTPTVNIGERQEGRIRGPSVIDCPERAEAITEAIRQALSSEHLERCRRSEHPYGDGHAAQRIVEILRDIGLNDLVLKRFHDRGTVS